MEDSVGDALRDAGSKLYHACQLQDFKSYCEENALLARSELEALELPYTKFYTDESDKEKGLWDRVFGNIEDFGRLFWTQPAGVPNAYGPITLVFGVNAWERLDDIAITERGAFYADFDLAAESMSPAEVRACFEDQNGQLKQIKWGLEVSSSSSRLSFSKLAYVLVDPITPTFREIVRTVADRSIRPSKIIERTAYGEPLDEGKLEVLENLVQWARAMKGEPPHVNELSQKLPNELSDWFKKVRRTQHGVLRQWLAYTYSGTLTLDELSESSLRA